MKSKKKEGFRNGMDDVWEVDVSQVASVSFILNRHSSTTASTSREITYEDLKKFMLQGLIYSETLLRFDCEQLRNEIFWRIY